MFRPLFRKTIEHTFYSAYKIAPGLLKYVVGELTIFLYHEVSDEPAPFAKDLNLSVPKRVFQEQVLWIQENFNIIHPEQLLTSNSQQLPERAAMITFDDGFRGAFENGISFLVSLNIPSLMFMNMRSTLQDRPMLSALAFYLEESVPEFKTFMRNENIKHPAFLNLNPRTLAKFENQHRINFSAALEYQGLIANAEIVQKWSQNRLVVLGNHLYEHWNSSSLTSEEFTIQYKKNAEALDKHAFSGSFFAFPNGQPGICFCSREVMLLSSLAVKRIFFSKGYSNDRSTDFLLDRVFLTSADENPPRLLFRLLLDRLYSRYSVFRALINWMTSTRK